jgi:hypothetical protein
MSPSLHANHGARLSASQILYIFSIRVKGLMYQGLVRTANVHWVSSQTLLYPSRVQLLA